MRFTGGGITAFIESPFIRFVAGTISFTLLGVSKICKGLLKVSIAAWILVVNLFLLRPMDCLR